MAGDWIKMRTDLYRDPKVSLIADDLMDEDSGLSRFVHQMTQRHRNVTRNVMRNAAIGALVSVWGVARHQGHRIGDDMHLLNVTPAAVDDIADMPGFCQAMVRVGWITIPDDATDTLCFPRFFEEHNTPPADSKEKNKERQKRYRERKRNAESDVTRDVTRASQSNAEKSREEKSREEKKVLPKGKTKVFVKPTVEEIQNYAAEAGLTLDANEFHDHYTSNGWRVSGKSPMKDWQASARNWARRNFSGSGSGSGNGKAPARKPIEEWGFFKETDDDTE